MHFRLIMNTVINKVLIRTRKLSVIAILVKFYGDGN